MDNKRKQMEIEGLKVEEGVERKKEDEYAIMNMELAANQLAMATERAKNDELDRLYFDTLPPGFRFHPTSEELIVHYLRNKVLNLPMPLNRIRDVNLYHFHPQQLSNMYKTYRENNLYLYFFTPRTRKYPNGSRPDRAAGNGYWKATGADKKIMSQGKVVGWQKSLVYYEGLAKDHSGKKTNWIMHEYVMAPPKDVDQDNAAAAGSSSHAGGTHGNSSTRPPNDNRLGDWVLCTIHCKPRKKEDGKQDAKEDPINGIQLEEGIDDQSESRDADHEEKKVINPDPVQYWSSRNIANVPMMISQQVSNSTLVHDGHEGFRPKKENCDRIPIHEQVFNPIPVRWDSSCSSRSTVMNGPAVMLNNQQFPNPSTLAQGHEGLNANYNINPLINPVRGHEWGFGNMENAPIRSNQLQVLDSSSNDHHLVLQGQGLTMSMDQNNIILPPLIDYYEQDSSNWMMIPAASDQPNLMNYHQSSARYLPPAEAAAAANHHAPDPPFMYNHIDHHTSGSQNVRADHQYNNSGVGAAASGSLEYYCEDQLSDPCNEYLEMANFPPPLGHDRS